MYMRSNKKILLIEDNLVAQFAAKQLLIHAGFNVDAACDGTDGVNLYRYYRYDLVILDIGLPDMKGYEVAKKLRHMHKKITLIAVTGYGQDKDKVNAKRRPFSSAESTGYTR